MKKKYKIKYKSVIIFAFLILTIFCCIRFYSKGYTIHYKLQEGKYEVTEIYTKNAKKEIDNYYIEVKDNDITYGFEFYHRFSKKRKVVSDIISYQGDYSCVLPIIDGKAQTDLLCYKNYRYYFYNSIIGEDSALDKFVEEIDFDLYDRHDWQDQITDGKKEENIILYSKNLVADHSFMVTNLKGVYQAKENVLDVSIFAKDIYQRDLSAFVGNYYVTADYSESQQFRTFYFVDMITGKKEESKAPNYISFDSYIQGIVDDKLYIYDRDNEKQYSISPKKKVIEEIGNSKKKIKYYSNGDWDKITTTKANKTLLFEDVTIDLDFQKYSAVYHIGGEVSGYYYLLEESKDGYILYRTPSQNKKLITYITTVSDKKDIFFLDDYVYFQEGGKIKYYHDETGVRTLLEYSELEFNKNLIFGVCKK